MLLKSTHIVACISSFFIFIPECSLGMDLANLFTTHQLMEICVVFRFLAITKKATRSLCKHVFPFFLGQYPGIGHRVSVCLTSLFFQDGCTIVHSHHPFQSCCTMACTLYCLLYSPSLLAYLGLNLYFPND